MQHYSFSFISRFQHCPMQWYYRYRLKPEIPEDDRPNNPLYLGILFEDIIKDGLGVASNRYYMKYPIIDDKHIHEVIKADYFANQVKRILPKGGEFEFQIQVDDFKGYADYIVKNEDETYTIYDFKYSNHVDNYRESSQLHLYKYYYELMTGNKVSNLVYIVAPKPFIKKEFEESEESFRKHLTNKIKEYKIDIVEVEYDHNKVIEFQETKYDMENGDASIVRNIGSHCSYCDYAKLCYGTKYKEEKEG